MMFRSYRTYLLAFVVTLLLCGTSRSAELLTVGGCVDCRAVGDHLARHAADRWDRDRR
jgi:hypothetical protein